jgi:hypothetical protein
VARIPGSSATFACAIFAAAFLLFWFEPMYAKRLLPLFGGSASVWNVTLFFYQSVLLLSYVYVHLTTVRLPVKGQVVLHIILTLIALAFLPVDVPDRLTAAEQEMPYLTLLYVLALEIGPVFFIVASTSPLLQRWYNLAQKSELDNPYRLYAVSNAGSLLGLLSYPFLFEPAFSIAGQNIAWSLFFVVLAASLCFLGIRAIRQQAATAHREGAGTVARRATINLGQRTRWFLLSAVPSALLLAVTLHLATDIAAAPFIWVLPLAVYLVTFVFTFADRQVLRPSWMLELHTWCLMALAIYFFIEDAWWLFALHLAGLFSTCMVCHGRLAAEAPDPDHLTEFYFWLALGGASGGFVAAVMAPNLFVTVAEYPLLLVAAVFLRPSDSSVERHPWLKSSAILLGFLGLVLAPLLLDAVDIKTSGTVFGMIYLGAVALVLLSLQRHTLRFGLAVSALFVAFVAQGELNDDRNFRSFHGVYKVSNSPDNKLRLLFSGTTIHGAQALTTALSKEPLTYYNRAGPMGQVARALDAATPDADIAAIGLGAGAITCLLPSSMNLTFIEIDTRIIEIATDPDLFTYLENCGSNTQITTGDGRLVISQAPEASYDAIILDAFSSDSIPVHLLTREALNTYLSKLKADGLLVLHLSNRFIDLVPVVGALARDRALAGLLQDYYPDSLAKSQGGFASTWVVLARTKKSLEPLENSGNWERLESGHANTTWSDDHADVFSQVLWGKLLWGAQPEQGQSTIN